MRLLKNRIYLEALLLKKLEHLVKTTIVVFIALSLVTILITGFWGTVSELILPNSTWGLYNKSFFENLLVEMHGGVIDLLIVGVILYWFDIQRTKKDTKEQAENNLANLEYYAGPDAPFKYYQALRYLASLQVFEVKIQNANLRNLQIKELKLTNSQLSGINFSGSTLKKVNLQNCKLQGAQFIDSKLKQCMIKDSNLERSKFINAELKGMNFEGCDIQGTTFKNCQLQSAIFKGVDCKNVSFKGSNLRSANFRGATNITKEMILEADNYKAVVLPEGMRL